MRRIPSTLERILAVDAWPYSIQLCSNAAPQNWVSGSEVCNFLSDNHYPSHGGEMKCPDWGSHSLLCKIFTAVLLVNQVFFLLGPTRLVMKTSIKYGS